MGTNVAKGIDWSAGQEVAVGKSAIEHFWSSRKWDQTTVIALVLGGLAVIITTFVIYRGYFGNIDTRIERSLIVSLLELYAFLKFPLGRKNWHDRLNKFFIIDSLLILVIIVTQVYTTWDVVVAGTEHLYVNLFATGVRVDHIVGVVVHLLLFEATRRAFGWILVAIPAFFIAYSLLAGYLPAPLTDVSASWTHMSEMLYVLNEGIYGIGAQVLLSMVFLYILFGAFITASKTGAFFTAAADSLVGRFSGGPAKAAVVGSAFMGSISGSAIANVATTGAITIPMMKKMGYKPEFAGAVETCASTAGYFTPPIMGASAFLIAAFTGIPYINICLYVAIPAMLYYVGLLTQVHFRAKKDNLRGHPQSELPSLKKVMFQGGHLILPLVLIIVALTMNYSVTRVAVWGIMAIIVVSLFRPETRMTPRYILLVMEKMLNNTMGVLLSLVICGVIQGSLMVTGLGFRLSMLVENAAMGSMVLGLVLAAFVALLLGTGLPAILVYYISVAFVIPALVHMGAVPITAHIFALMFGAMAMITPPVCVAAYTASAIADAGPMKTGFTASRLGFAGYMVPFLFVLNPAILLSEASILTSLVSIAIAIIGLAALAAGFEGWLIKRTTILERGLLFGGGLCLMAFEYFCGQNVPNLEMLFGGVGMGAVIIVTVTQLLRKERSGDKVMV
jgi:TRAP transporter 4TM/12TM fusion protein